MCLNDVGADLLDRADRLSDNCGPFINGFCILLHGTKSHVTKKSACLSHIYKSIGNMY